MEPIIVETVDQKKFDPQRCDGGLLPLPGVQCYQVFRASKAVPELCDDKGWTYNHHIDMACWKGKLYVAWNQCECDEDIWPSREVYSTSIDGIHWDKPRELFPQGDSTCLRMYYFVAPNGRMIVIAGLRVDHDKTNEDTKGGIIVREIRADHSLGEIFTLQKTNNGFSRQPMFDSCTDSGFVDACRALLNDVVYLEQQDRGMLLGDRRMKWHDASAWPGGKVPGDNPKWVAGKAYSFFRRRDGVVVGISKMGWTTTTRDNGKTWSQPIDLTTLVTGKAKVWCQELPQGRIALVYNPTERARFPLAVVSSDDQVHFGNMRIVHGELPRQRYEGDDRSVGPQYTRGISYWSTDRSRNEDCFWLVYSMSKEDIWVARVPIHVAPEAPQKVEDDFSQSPRSALPSTALAGWNVYRPRWADVDLSEGSLKIMCQDPDDYVRLDRIVSPRNRLCVRIELSANQNDRGQLDIELLGEYRSPRAVQISLSSDQQITARDADKAVSLGRYEPGAKISIEICADASAGSYSVRVNNSASAHTLRFSEPTKTLHRLTLRTGPYRNLGGTERIDPQNDRPTRGVRFELHKVSMDSF